MEQFILTTRGMAASIWLSRLLNLHPDILCSANILPPSIYNVFGKTKSFSPDFKTQPKTPPDNQIDHNTSVVLPERVKLSVETIFEDLISYSEEKNFKAYGLLHCYNLFELEKNLKTFNVNGAQYNIANIVRSPISYTYTLYNHRAHEYRELPHSKSAVDNFLQECAEEGKKSKLSALGLQNDSVKDANFYFALLGMVSQVEDYQEFQRIRFFKMEDLKTDAAVISKLFNVATGYSVFFNEDYLDYWLSEENLGVGRFVWRAEENKKKSQNLTDEEMYNGWPPHWQELYRTFYNDAPGSDIASTFYDVIF